VSYFYPGVNPDYSRGYDNDAPENVAYRLQLAIDRDERLTTAEVRVYNDTLIELEYGPDFFFRAHP